MSQLQFQVFVYQLFVLQPAFSSTPTNGSYTTSGAVPLLQQYRASSGSLPGSSSLPGSGPGHYQRHVLGSLGSQENIGRQQQQQQQQHGQHVLFKGPGGRKPSPLSEHTHVAKTVRSAGGTPPSAGKGMCLFLGKQ